MNSFMGRSEIKNGNLTSMEHLDTLLWDLNMISKVVKGIDTEYYIYSGMNRVQKITKFGATNEVRETIYLGGCELKRISQASGTVILERWDSHIMDDTSRIATVNHWEQDTLGRENDLPVTKGGPSVTKIRYSYGNHLGSTSLELNDTGGFVSYQEYFPFGGTSYTVGEVSSEYRFTGKELDELTFYSGMDGSLSSSPKTSVLSAGSLSGSPKAFVTSDGSLSGSPKAFVTSAGLLSGSPKASVPPAGSLSGSPKAFVTSDGSLSGSPKAFVTSAGLLSGSPKTSVLSAGSLSGSPKAFVTSDGSLSGSPKAFVTSAGLLSGSPKASVPPAGSLSGSPKAFVTSDGSLSGSPKAFVPSDGLLSGSPKAFVPSDGLLSGSPKATPEKPWNINEISTAHMLKPILIYFP